jgi:Ca2+-binding RTX toxin-like protein
MSSNATGTGEIAVNSYATGDQLTPSVTALSDGGWVVTWHSRGEDGDSWGVYQQRYHADGTVAGAETVVNTYTTSDQYMTDVAGLSDGGWIVTWMSYGQDGDSLGIYQQRFDAHGAALGGEMHVNTYITGSQFTPSVTALADGGWVTSWMSYSEDGDAFGVYQRRYGADGHAFGNAELVNTYTTADQQLPSLAALPDGGWIVAWYSDGEDGDSNGIYQRRYAADGSPMGGEILVNSYTTSSQAEPAVTALADGGWLVTWDSVEDGSSNGIYQQRYASNGAAEGNENEINTYTTGLQYGASVATLADGGWVVTWTSSGEDGSGLGVYQQRYTRYGVQVGGETPVNLFTAGNQSNAKVTATADGGWVVTWNSANEDGSAGGVYQRHFAPDITPDSHGNSKINGTVAGEYLIGYGGNDRIDGKGGNDVLIGGFGNDTYIITAPGDIVEELPAQGNDTVLSAITFDLTSTASVENLTLTGAGKHNGFGNALDNRISGNTAINILRGRAGEDEIIGNKGNDKLYGGADADQFVFVKGDGKDVVADFEAKGPAHDVIDLSHDVAFTSFADLKAHHMSEHGASVVINDGAGDTITLEHVVIKDLTSTDFQF